MVAYIERVCIMTLEFVSLMNNLIILFLSYMITFTISGWFEAFVAESVGDDTAYEHGFLSLNPMDHFSLSGFAALVITYFYTPSLFLPGWGRHIPLIPEMLHGKFLNLRIFIEYMSRSFGHFIILLMTTICMIVWCDAYTLQSIFFSMQPTTSFVQALTTLLRFLFTQNLLLTVIHFVVGLFKYGVYFYFPQFKQPTLQSIIAGFVILMIGFMIFGDVLTLFVLKLVAYIQSTVVHFVK